MSQAITKHAMRIVNPLIAHFLAHPYPPPFSPLYHTLHTGATESYPNRKVATRDFKYAEGVKVWITQCHLKLLPTADLVRLLQVLGFHNRGDAQL